MATATLCDRCMAPIKQGTGSALDVTLSGNRDASVKAADLCPECATVVEGIIATRIHLKDSNASVFRIKAPAPPTPTAKAVKPEAPKAAE